MDRTEQLGKNIKCLRLAFGETQEQLGAAIMVEKNTISSYERGRTEPSKEVLSLIAAHYMISVEELMSAKFYDVGKVQIKDKKIIFRNLDVFFPVALTDDSLKNEHFKKAYYTHMEMLDLLKEENLAGFEKIDICVNEYMDAYKDSVSKEEAAVNLIGFGYLFFWIFRTLPQMSEIADYYLALQFYFSIINNDNEYGFNRKIGEEMLYAFISVENKYAARCMLKIHSNY